MLDATSGVRENTDDPAKYCDLTPSIFQRHPSAIVTISYSLGLIPQKRPLSTCETLRMRSPLQRKRTLVPLPLRRAPRQAQRTKASGTSTPVRSGAFSSISPPQHRLRREREDRSRSHQRIGDSIFFQAISLRRRGKPSHSTIFMVRHCAMRRRHRPRCRFAERLQSSRLPSHPQLAATVRAPPRYA